MQYEDTHADKGFTLIEVLVSVVLLGIAVAIVLQLFSANVRALATSEDYIYASAGGLLNMINWI